MSKTFIEPVKKNGVLQFYSPSGEKVRKKYIWNENRDDLVLKEEIDVIAEMNERAKGTSIVEQIARLERGDSSVIDQKRVTPDDFETDVSGMPEHPIDVIDRTVQAKARAMALREMEAQARADAEDIKKLKADLIAAKENYDKALKAFDDKKAQPVVNEKEGEK